MGHPRLVAWLAPLGVAVATLAVFARAVTFDFIQSWDDGAMLLYNANLVEWNFRWMWRTFYFGHWVPITWMTHTWDAHVWGTWAGGWHLENVLLHAGSAVIVYFIALRILAHRGGALVTALVFSLHPLRIESVVWISERKDVLSCFFVVLAVLLYLRAVERRRFPWLALGAFVLGFMSKPIAVVLPVYLVALDWAVLRRWAWKEKLPFVAVSAAGSAIAFYAMVNGINNLLAWRNAGLEPRLLHVAYSEVYYAWRTLWPSRLSYMIEYTWVPRGRSRSIRSPWRLYAWRSYYWRSYGVGGSRRPCSPTRPWPSHRRGSFTTGRNSSATAIVIWRACRWPCWLGAP